MNLDVQQIIHSEELNEKAKFKKLLPHFRESKSTNKELRYAVNQGFSPLRLKKMIQELQSLYPTLKVVYKVEPPQEGTPQEGTPQEGTPQEGTPQEGTPQEGTPQEGTPQEGTPQNFDLTADQVDEKFTVKELKAELKKLKVSEEDFKNFNKPALIELFISKKKEVSES